MRGTRPTGRVLNRRLGPKPELPFNIRITDYATDPELFRSDMECLADLLAKEGF